MALITIGVVETSVNWLFLSNPKATEQIINENMAYIAINTMLSDQNIDMLSLRSFNVAPYNKVVNA